MTYIDDRDDVVAAVAHTTQPYAALKYGYIKAEGMSKEDAETVAKALSPDWVLVRRCAACANPAIGSATIKNGYMVGDAESYWVCQKHKGQIQSGAEKAFYSQMNKYKQSLSKVKTL
jgi:hypothetical protein